MPGTKPSRTAENGDSRRVAADFVDLWQDQVGALADDHSLSEALESMLAMLDRAATADTANAGPDHDGNEHIEPSGDGSNGESGGESGGGAAGAAAPGPAPGDDVEHIDELRRRIAECQSRIAALES